MHARSRLVAIAMAVLTTASLVAQSPVAPPTGGAPDKSLITPLPIDGADAPIAIPETSAESITAAETAVLAAHDATIAAAEALAFDRLFSSLVPTNRGAMITDGRLTLTQDEVMAATRRDFAGCAAVHYTYAHRHVTLLSMTSAILVGDGSVAATAIDGATFTRPFAQTIVFMRIGDAWKVIHLHSSTPLATLGR